MRRRAARPRRSSLAGSMAKTALLAGTAQSAAGRVAMRQQESAAKGAAKAAPRAKPGMLTDEIVDQLKKYAELRDAGVITEDEFAARKARLMPR